MTSAHPQVIDHRRPRRHVAEQFELFAASPRQPLAVELLVSAHNRRLCPIVVSGAPMGGTGDLGTLVIDGTHTTDKEAVLP